ncbi:MAG: hypothetical protein HOC79_04050 [Euryarchaeota archaeon]|nr:hypothetical protein [Euryarchaeota archaeon]
MICKKGEKSRVCMTMPETGKPGEVKKAKKRPKTPKNGNSFSETAENRKKKGPKVLFK